MSAYYLTFALLGLLCCSACNSGGSTIPLLSSSANVEIEAALIQKSGGVTPAARMRVFLLSKDLEGILKNYDFISELDPKMKKVAQGIRDSGENVKLFATLYRYSLDDDLDKPSVQMGTVATLQGLNAIKPYTIKEITTDFQGKARITNVDAGTYYIFGYTNINRSVVLWNLRTDFTKADNKIILEIKNASVILE